MAQLFAAVTQALCYRLCGLHLISNASLRAGGPGRAHAAEVLVALQAPHSARSRRIAGSLPKLSRQAGRNVDVDSYAAHAQAFEPLAMKTSATPCSLQFVQRVVQSGEMTADSDSPAEGAAASHVCAHQSGDRDTLEHPFRGERTCVVQAASAMGNTAGKIYGAGPGCACKAEESDRVLCAVETMFAELRWHVDARFDALDSRLASLERLHRPTGVAQTAHLR